jgi:hypothetical protein
MRYIRISTGFNTKTETLDPIGRNWCEGYRKFTEQVKRRRCRVNSTEKRPVFKFRLRSAGPYLAAPGCATIDMVRPQHARERGCNIALESTRSISKENRDLMEACNRSWFGGHRAPSSCSSTCTCATWIVSETHSHPPGEQFSPLRLHEQPISNGLKSRPPQRPHDRWEKDRTNSFVCPLH